MIIIFYIIWKQGIKLKDNLKQEIIEKIISQEGLKVIREEAVKIFKSENLESCFSLAKEFYESNHFQVQELGVFLLGYISYKNEGTLHFLKETVSQNEDWRVQEILAMAFDSFCKAHGYEESIPVMEEWLSSECANTRRAVTEGLRIWTSRPFFKEHPDKAIALIAPLRDDKSEYVRKSVGNSLRDISKKFPELIKAEILSWDISYRRVMQVYKLAGKLVL